jgi:hypothetical protein
VLGIAADVRERQHGERHPRDHRSAIEPRPGDDAGNYRNDRQASRKTYPIRPGTLPVSPGFFAGWQTVTHTLRLNDVDHATSAGTNEFYKSDGTVYRTGCSTATAERFE